MDLDSRVSDFLTSIEDYKPGDKPTSNVVDIFNALLKIAQEQLADDPIVQAISPVAKSTMGTSMQDVGSMRTAMNQISGALGGDDF
jgi:hypothetical protein